MGQTPKTGLSYRKDVKLLGVWQIAVRRPSWLNPHPFWIKRGSMAVAGDAIAGFVAATNGGQRCQTSGNVLKNSLVSYANTRRSFLLFLTTWEVGCCRVGLISRDLY